MIPVLTNILGRALLAGILSVVACAGKPTQAPDQTEPTPEVTAPPANAEDASADDTAPGAVKQGMAEDMALDEAALPPPPPPFKSKSDKQLDYAAGDEPEDEDEEKTDGDAIMMDE